MGFTKMPMICKKRDCDITEEKELELHHIIPRFMGGNDTNGRKYLCKKHHNIIGLLTPSILWNFIPEQDKERAREAVKSFTINWINKK